MIKNLIKTIGTAGIIFGVVFTIFINGILFTTGVISITVGATSLALKKSQEIIKNLDKSIQLQKVKLAKLKKNYALKSNKLTNNFIKRLGIRVSSHAVAASTVGTAAVISVVSMFEIQDYCAKQEEIILESNILFDKDEKFDNEKCFERAKEDTKKIGYEAIESIKDISKDTKDALLDMLENILNLFKESGEEIKSISEDFYNKFFK